MTRAKRSPGIAELGNEMEHGYGVAIGTGVPENRTGLRSASKLEDAKRLARYQNELDGRARVVFNVETGQKKLGLQGIEDHKEPSFQVMPPLSDDIYQALKADIAENGITYPIIKEGGGRTIDGHHREQAWKELVAEGAPITEVKELPVEYKTLYSVAEGRDEAWRLNMLRRLMNTNTKQTRIKEKLKESPEYSNRQIGRLLGVKHDTVGKLRKELEESGQLATFEPVLGRGKTTRTEATNGHKEEGEASKELEESGEFTTLEEGAEAPSTNGHTDLLDAPVEEEPVQEPDHEVRAEETDSQDNSDDVEQADEGSLGDVGLLAGDLPDIFVRFQEISAREVADVRREKMEEGDLDYEIRQAERVSDFFGEYIQHLKGN